MIQEQGKTLSPALQQRWVCAARRGDALRGDGWTSRDRAPVPCAAQARGVPVDCHRPSASGCGCHVFNNFTFQREEWRSSWQADGADLVPLSSWR